MQTRSPINSDSPKLVEMVRVKPLSLGFGDYLFLNEAEVDGRICNLITVNNHGAHFYPKTFCSQGQVLRATTIFQAHHSFWL
jgi:hypothetical protein